MAELVPIPFGTLLRRAHHERLRRDAIFDLPARKFYRPARDPDSPLDVSVPYAGARAQNPFGPAAGPHTQLAQNIALSWLAGARIIELKTVQIKDHLRLSRPCIDMATVGYNTEWSQELRLADSLREYVKASMLVELLDAAGVLGGPGGDVVFDISVGYDLAGIRSAAVVAWLETMRDARALVEELRPDIPPEFAHLRDLPFRTEISRSITLSTFHGTPADEIERVSSFLIDDLGFHTVIKLNPPMLGRERVEHILHDVLGYHDIEVNPDCYPRSLAFDEAVGVVRRLERLAEKRGLSVGVKCGNTLEVLNKGMFLREPVQYLSGQPLHALHAALGLRWREACGAGLQISFSAGVDAQNAADCVAAGLVPVTACTDLLRAGGFGRLSRYVTNLEARMKEVGAVSVPEFILRSAHRHQGSPAADLPAAVQVNATTLLDRALTDERYRAARNRKAPRKLGTRLWLWDCLTCDKCVPACPNDSMFDIDVEPFIGEVPVIEVTRGGWREVDRRLYRLQKHTQLATFADACNDCGNCDVHCPEDGGPFAEKPRFFGSVETWRRAAPLGGFVLTRESGAIVLRGRFAAGTFVLRRDQASPAAVFSTGAASVTVSWTTGEVVAAALTECTSTANPEPRTPNPESRIPNPVLIDLSHFLTMRTLVDALTRPERVNFVNAPLVQ